MSKSDAGKGDDPRPVDIKKYRKNHDAINWCKHDLTQVNSDYRVVCRECGKVW